MESSTEDQAESNLGSLSDIDLSPVGGANISWACPKKSHHQLLFHKLCTGNDHPL